MVAITLKTIPYSFSYGGHLFSGIAEYEPAEPATALDPSIPAIATILEVYMGDSVKDCYEHINPSTIQALEQKIIQDMEA